MIEVQVAEGEALLLEVGLVPIFPPGGEQCSHTRRVSTGFVLGSDMSLLLHS